MQHASKIGSSTSIAAVMQSRSRTVEMPSGLSLPLAFGMNTLLIGFGWYAKQKRKQTADNSVSAVVSALAAGLLQP
jgi:hypothetical protein